MCLPYLNIKKRKKKKEICQTAERLTFQSWCPQPEQPRWDGNLQTSLDPEAQEEAGNHL